MKQHTSLIVGLLALLLNFIPRDLGSAPRAEEPNPLLAIAERYLEKLCDQDVEALATMLDKKALFEDPTRVTITGNVQRIEGRAAMLAHFEQKSNQRATSTVEIVESFVTGEHVVMRLNYRSKSSANVVRMEEGNEKVSLAIPAVTILRIQNERVVHHLDHVDYASILRQVADGIK